MLTTSCSVLDPDWAALTQTASLPNYWVLSGLWTGGIFPVLPVCPYGLKLRVCVNEPSVSFHPPQPTSTELLREANVAVIHRRLTRARVPASHQDEDLSFVPLDGVAM